MNPYIFDAETNDPDDYLTLLLLLGHPQVDLKAVTITPGSREQVSLVRQTLRICNREDVEVGANDINTSSSCVSAWHYKAYPNLVKGADDAPLGWEVLARHLKPGTTLVCGAALKNLGALLRNSGAPAASYGRVFIQGGFAGEGVVPRDQQLEKFKGRVSQPTFNLGGDPGSAELVIRSRPWFEDLRFVSKNVCHGVYYDSSMHEVFKGLGSSCSQSLALIREGMGYYLAKKPEGKKFHDPLAACCAIDPTIGDWAMVDLYREVGAWGGSWGSKLNPESGVRIIVGYNHDKFLQTLTAQHRTSS